MFPTRAILRHRLPRTTALAKRLEKTEKRKDSFVEAEITIFPHLDPFRVQRDWRFAFGLVQDCNHVTTAGGFKKRAGEPFKFALPTEMISRFVREIMPHVASDRVLVRIEGKRLPRRLLEVMAA